MLMRAFNNLTLLPKLLIPIAVLVLVSLGLVVMASVSFKLLEDNAHHIVDVSAARATLALRLTAAIDEATIQEKNAILETSQTEREQAGALYAQARQKSFAAADALVGLSDSPERRATNEGVKQRVTAFYAVSERVLALAMRGETALATKMSDGEARALRRDLMGVLGERADVNVAALAAEKARAYALTRTATWTLIGSGAFGLILAMGLAGLIVAGGVSRPLKAMAAAMNRLAEGDLAVAVTGAERKDEVGSLARSLQVFKDNAIASREAAASQAAENAAKIRRAELLDATTRPHHLDGEHPLGAVGIKDVGLVDLGDRGRRHGFAEGDEQLPHRLAERRLDDAHRLALGEGRHPVLELLEVEGGIHADDVGARREELAELHVGGPEPRQGPLERTGAGAEARPLQGAPELEGEAQVGWQLRRIDEGEGALARQHEADADAAEEVDDPA